MGQAFSDSKKSSHGDAAKRECAPVFERIAYLHDILGFACSELIDAVHYSHVSHTWRETVVLYGAPIWRTVADCTRQEPGFANCFLNSLRAPQLTWAVKNIYDPQQGALDPNINYYDVKSALFCAVKAVVDVNHYTPEQRIVLQENVKTLLDAGAAPNYVAGRGIALGECSVLSIAVDALAFAQSRRSESDLETIRLLVKAGASCLIESRAPTTHGGGVPSTQPSPLCLAADFGDVEIMRIFLEDLGKEQQQQQQQQQQRSDDGGQIILHLASGGHAQAIAALLHSSAVIKLDAVDPDNNNALHHVARSSSIPYPTIEKIVNFFSSAEYRLLFAQENNAGQTPLMVAAACGTDAVGPLVDHMSEEHVNMQSSVTGMTALHYACRYYDTNLRILLEHGGKSLEIFDSNGQLDVYTSGGGSGRTVGRLPIHVMCEMGPPDGLKLLLEAGADPTAAVLLPADSPPGAQKINCVAIVCSCGGPVRSLELLSQYSAAPNNNNKNKASLVTKEDLPFLVRTAKSSGSEYLIPMLEQLAERQQQAVDGAAATAAVVEEKEG